MLTGFGCAVFAAPGLSSLGCALSFGVWEVGCDVLPFWGYYNAWVWFGIGVAFLGDMIGMAWVEV